jgi:lipid II:glycine glycyltransferase (peptidoglycan interpeptide bridge formation enzyme)
VRTITDTFKKDTFLLQALDHGDVIAASLFLRHGARATHYLSWTTNHGRERNAAHLLLWQGALSLREAAVKWLDLGGMDARGPGIARFKLGLGADAVTYSGTWF